MARTEAHAAYGFLTYYLIYIIWMGTFLMPRYLTFLACFFGIFPDLDAVYWVIKKRDKGFEGKQSIDTEFQHHLYFWTHWPISYSPLILIFIISLIFNFYPEYFLVPVISIYCGHLIPDSISCGDGLMWGKIPWKKDRYARYINLWSNKTDGYHGIWWEARYRQTIWFKIGSIAVIASIIIILMLYINEILQVLPGLAISGYYILPLLFLSGALIIGFKKIPEDNLKEPPEGRYADYRVNLKYINGLREKNRKKHIEKYSELFKEKGIIEKINLK